MTSKKEHNPSRKGPRSTTLRFLRQFARVYMPMPQLPGMILN